MKKQHLKKLDEKLLSDHGIGQKLVSLTSSKPHNHLKKEIVVKSFYNYFLDFILPSENLKKIISVSKEIGISPNILSGFPHYRRGGLFKWFKLEPWGWEDRGEVKGKDVPLPKEEWYEIKGYYASHFSSIVKTKEVFTGCSQCKEILHIGRENNQSFRFCPKCLTKIKE